MRHALTVDVEEWFHVCGIERVVPADQWDRLESRVEAATRRVLDLLDRHQTRATFFVLGWIAQRHPQLVQTIRAAGHEIASHGMWHRKVFHLTPAQFEADLRESRDLLASIVGAAPTAFRAPEWSIDAERRTWAYPILAKLGFRDDSSVSPITWISGSRLETRPFLWRDRASDTSLRVFPVTTVRLFWENLPFTGGMGLRTTAYWYTAWQFEQLDRRGEPGMIYLHPWEFDLDQPKLPLGGVLDFVHRFNLRAVQRNVSGLLKHFEFAPLSEALDQVVPRPTSTALALASTPASDAPVEPIAAEPAREESVA